MKTGINLLPYFEQESEKDQQTKKWLTIFSTTLLVVVSISIIILLIGQIRLKKEIAEIIGPTQKLESSITGQRDKEATIRIIKMKTSLAAKIYSEPSPFLKIFQFLIDNKPEGIVFNEISLPNTKTVTFSGTSTNALSFSEFFNNLLDKEKGRKQFTSLQLESFSGSKIGDYSFSFSATLPIDK